MEIESPFMPFGARHLCKLRNRLWLIMKYGSFVAIFVVIIGLLWKLFPPAISESNFERIRIGMNRIQVEAILGKPRKDVRPKDPAWIDPNSMVGRDDFNPEEWWGSSGVIRIWYENDNVVHFDCIGLPCEVVRLSVWDRWQALISGR